MEEISDDEAQAAAAPGHEPGHDAPSMTLTWPHGWYGGWCKAPTFQNQPAHCELRGGGEEGPWIEATQFSGRSCAGLFGHGARGEPVMATASSWAACFLRRTRTTRIHEEDVERWLYAAGGIDPVRPMIEYPGV